MTPEQFRAMLPEFANQKKYADASITFWIDVGASFVNEGRWGALADFGIALCAAHHLVIAKRDQATAAKGCLPGVIEGPLASLSVDKISTSRDTGAVTLTEAAFWNMTAYGVRYFNLAQMMGAGGIQL